MGSKQTKSGIEQNIAEYLFTWNVETSQRAYHRVLPNSNGTIITGDFTALVGGDHSIHWRFA